MARDQRCSSAHREFDLLELLMRNAGSVMSRGTLFAGVWGHQVEQSWNVVDVYVRYVRDKIDRPFDRDSIETVRGAQRPGTLQTH